MVLHAAQLLVGVVPAFFELACQRGLVDVESVSEGVEQVVVQGFASVSLATGIP